MVAHQTIHFSRDPACQDSHCSVPKWIEFRFRNKKSILKRLIPKTSPCLETVERETGRRFFGFWIKVTQISTNYNISTNLKGYSVARTVCRNNVNRFFSRSNRFHRWSLSTFPFESCCWLRVTCTSLVRVTCTSRISHSQSLMGTHVFRWLRAEYLLVSINLHLLHGIEADKIKAKKAITKKLDSFRPARL